MIAKQMAHQENMANVEDEDDINDKTNNNDTKHVDLDYLVDSQMEQENIGMMMVVLMIY